MITIFANIRINDEGTLQHLKDSFFSFNTISDDWLINIRGNLRGEAMSFLQENLGDKMIPFELLDDTKGWINNSLEMLKRAKYDYLLVWNEDHLNLAPQNIYAKIVSDMDSQKADYLLYSWWQFGKARKAFESVKLTANKNIDTVYLTKKEWKKVKNAGHLYYLISLCGIFRKDFFKKLLLKDRIKFPMFFTKNLYRLMTLINYLGFKFNQRKYFHFINKLFLHKFRRFTKETPFDLEKSPHRTDVLPMKLAISRQELFACIDDDLDMPGYQLIKRGVYPPTVHFDIIHNQKDIASWGSKKILEQNDDYVLYELVLREGKEYSQRYYEDEVRTNTLLKKTIILISGSIEVVYGDDKAMLPPGHIISLYPNIKHTIKTKEDSVIIVVSSSLYDKKIKNIIN